MFKIFEMDNEKSVAGPMTHHFKLYVSQSPQTYQTREYMNKVSYASVVGSLMYLMVCTRPYLGYSVSMVNRFMANPGEEHWSAVKWILRYIRGTLSTCLIFKGSEVNGNLVNEYVDSDYAGSMDTRKSLT